MKNFQLIQERQEFDATYSLLLLADNVNLFDADKKQ
jgi:hypothetical protein